MGVRLGPARRRGSLTDRDRLAAFFLILIRNGKLIEFVARTSWITSGSRRVALEISRQCTVAVPKRAVETAHETVSRATEGGQLPSPTSIHDTPVATTLKPPRLEPYEQRSSGIYRKTEQPRASSFHSLHRSPEHRIRQVIAAVLFQTALLRSPRFHFAKSIGWRHYRAPLYSDF